MVAKKILEIPDEDLFWRWGINISKSADDVLYLLQNRLKFLSIKEMFETNQALGGLKSPVFGWIWRLWGTEVLMMIRRELDDQAGTINLRHTLHEMERRPEVLTRDRFLSGALLDADCCDFSARERANTLFDGFGIVRSEEDPDFDYIDPAIIRSDRKKLEDKTAEAFRYAQCLVAHRTPKSDLELYESAADQSITAITETLKKYYLITDGERLDLSAVVLPPNWLDTFKMAWAPPEMAGSLQISCAPVSAETVEVEMAEDTKGPFQVALEDLGGMNTEKMKGTITDEQGNEKEIETETEKSWNDKIKPDSDSDDNN